MTYAVHWSTTRRTILLKPGEHNIPLFHNVPCFLPGGWHASTENTDKVECYDPKTNQWTMCAPMKERRYRPGVAVVDGKIYVLGGEEGWDR